MPTIKAPNLSFNIQPGSEFTFNLERGATNAIIEGNKNGEILIEGRQIDYTPNVGFVGIEELVCSYKIKSQKYSQKIIIKVGYTFKAKSHILSLLGDELIGSDSLAIFELIKNSYDADAEVVNVTFRDLNTPDQVIVIEDDGCGMTLDTIQNVWLEIGTDFKRGQNRKVSQVFNRISLGEKGVGRLAVHKLGKSVTLETQPKGSRTSYKVELNWQNLMDDNEYINEASVNIEKIRNSTFPKNQGTRVTISDLKKENWEKRDLKELAKKVNSIKSPFTSVKGGFDVNVYATNERYQKWIDEVKSVDDILNDHIYYFEFNLKKNDESNFANLSWEYRFKPPKSFGIKSKSILHPDRSENDVNYNAFSIDVDKDDGIYSKEQKHLKNSDLLGIGEITGRFYVFNLLSVVLKNFGQTNVIKSYIKQNCGVKIFRDGIRVYNYGELNDDWLQLDLARVQRLGEHFSKNTVIGSVEITQEGSSQMLKEKTNREGFDDNSTYRRFQNICRQIFDLFEDTAIGDRQILRDYLEGLKPTKVGLPEVLDQLHIKLKAKGVDKELAPLLKRVEKDYNDMRDVMLNSGLTGINLGLVFHEVDREVRFINSDLRNDVDIKNIKQRVKNLMQLLEDFAPILQQNKNVQIEASKLVEKAKHINNPRFVYHRVLLSSPLLTGENKDFIVNGPNNLLISALSNIIDNAIYWVTNKRELEGETYKAAIYIGTDMDNFAGPAIIIADNGKGFSLEPQDLILPYRTTRPGGMGLGLYFVNMVMELIGGKLLFPDFEEVNLPKAYRGAILALVFPKE